MTIYIHNITKLTHRKAGLLKDTASSTRLMGSMQVCNKPRMDRLAVLTWSEDCAMGRCKNCPTWKLEVPAGRGDEVITLALWGEMVCPIKDKKVILSYSYDLHHYAHNRFMVGGQ